MNIPFSRWRLIGAAVAALAVIASAAAEEKWMRVDAKFFTVYAQTSREGEARDWAVDFEQFRRGMMQVMRISPVRLKPAMVVIFRDDKALRPFKPLNKDGTRKEVAGFSAQLPARQVMMTSYDGTTEQTRQSMYYNGALWFLGGFPRRAPDWFRVGFGELFKTFTVYRDEFTIGLADGRRVTSLRNMDLVPMDRIFGVETKDLAFGDDEPTQRFYAQSWLFMHYALFGRDSWKDKSGHGAQLQSFMDALQRGVPEKEALMRSFERDPKQMTRELLDYLHTGSYVMLRRKFVRAEIERDLKVRVIDEAEVEVVKGQVCLATRDLVGAGGHFGRASLLDENSPLVSEGRGDLAQVENNMAEASERYAQAAERGSTSYFTWFFLADAFVRESSKGTPGLPAFEPVKARQAATRFERAINSYPFYLPSFERLALLMPSLEKFTAADRDFLELGKKLAPTNALIEAGLGVWEMKNGEAGRGSARLRALMDAPATGDAAPRQIAQRMLANAAVGGEEGEVRRLFAEGKATEAGEALDKLIANPRAAGRRAELLALRREIGQAELLARAEKFLGDNEPDSAAVLIDGVLAGELTPEVRARAEALRARATGKK